jgi:hypothetical protein
MLWMFAYHFALALALFFLTNWLGKHAVDFGYSSTTLFEDTTESVALNFFVRALSPAVFIVIVAAIVVAAGIPEWRLGLYWVSVYTYAIRAIAIFLLNRHLLVSWPRFFVHATSGISLALVAYSYLILPGRSLLPDLETAGNELWLAIIAFLYAIANRVILSNVPTAKRQNAFIKEHYNYAKRRFGGIIESRIPDPALQLITYSILVLEDFSRPPFVRKLERLLWFKKNKSTGIMQVRSLKPLTDTQSVELGVSKLISSWNKHVSEEPEDLFRRMRETVADYNRDEDYVYRVETVLEIIVKRVDNRFTDAFERIYSHE